MWNRAAIASSSRTWGRRLAIAVAAWLALWLLAWAAVPPLVKWQGEKRLSEALGREVKLGAVEFRPWSLTFTLRDCSVAAAAGGGSRDPQLSVARIVANIDWMSLLRFAPVIEAVQVDAPRLRLVRLADGRYDVDDILHRLAPKSGAPAATSGPPRFALYNVQLRDGTVSFDDRPVARKHELNNALLTLPFLSDLPSQVNITVEPRLAFTLDGTRFDTGAQTRPFARNRATAVQLRTGELDLAPWRAYLPRDLPIELQRGHLQTELELRFALRDDGTPVLSLQGEVHARDWAVAQRGGAPLAAWRAVHVTLRDVQPLARRIVLGGVKAEGLELQLARDEKGVFTMARLQGDAPPPSKSDTPWQLEAASVELAGARLSFSDASMQPAASVVLAAVDARSGPVAWPRGQPASLSMTARLSGELPRRLQLQGRVALDASLAWSADPDKMLLAVKRAGIDDLQVVDASTNSKRNRDAQGWKRLELVDAQVDVLAREVTLGGLKLTQARLGAERGSDGALALAGWPIAPRGAAADTPAQASGTPWRVHVHEAGIDDAQLRWRDARPGSDAAPGGVKLDVSGLNASARNFEWPSGKPAELRLAAARVADAAAPRDARAGSLDWQGRVGAQPWSFNGALRAERLPLHLLEPYLDLDLNLSVLRADAGWRGDVAVRLLPEGLQASARGNALLAGVRVNARNAATGAPTDDELLSWQALSLRSVNVTLAPKARPRVEVGEAAVADFYSRLVISEQGRFNLRDVAAPAGVASAPPGGFAVSKPAHAPASAASAPAQPDEPLPFDLSVGGLRLVNGRIDFSDHFVRPNYSAVLSELNGRLGAFRSGTREMAALELRGKMAGTADLDIRGSLNPTADPLALDVGARATDLELAPLSPYAGKYAGYAIERGKLSMDVHYNVQPDGRLEASNHVVLNQLTFGEKIDSPDATKLPVLLAVALLKDRNGVIDVNLPVNGSVRDPQFSVAGLIARVLGNLLLKALTSPFSLLAGAAGGGGEELSSVEFVPGTAAITQNSRAGLEKVAKAMSERPALKMTVTGAADPVSEAEAMKSAQLEQRLVAERRRELLRAGSAASAPASVSGDERARLVKSLYAAADIPNKPRNLLGLAKDIPVPEMEALLKSHMLISADNARELALQRGIAVRDALVAQGLTSERLFLAAPRLGAAGEGDAAWTPRVRLELSTR
jgi:uncharacterized protein involved in outer membrane biogenesis